MKFITRYTPAFPHRFAAIALLALLPFFATAQCDKVADACSVELLDFLTDGQYYRAQVIDGEEAQLKVTFFEGFTYRVVACTDNTGSKINYKLYDGSGQMVFDNGDVPDGTGWDFEIGATDEFTIKASLSEGMGCIIFEIGYDDEMFLDENDWVEEEDPFFEDELEDELDYDEEGN